jgi:hypothetical protein
MKNTFASLLNLILAEFIILQLPTSCSYLYRFHTHSYPSTALSSPRLSHLERNAYALCSVATAFLSYFHGEDYTIQI